MSITTYTGLHFDPVEPDENLIKIKDIAHALSMICRANGHTKIFYSVAQHSIACAKEASQQGLSKELVLGCLLHDASEAYLSDVTRPINFHGSIWLSGRKSRKSGGGNGSTISWAVSGCL